jgi:hypothetical protein
LWGLAGLLSARAVAASDALVALGSEVWERPLWVAAPHLVLAVLCVLLRDRRWRWSAPLPVAVALGWLWMTPDAPPQRIEGGAGPDIVLLTLDTFRADHVARAPRVSDLEQYTRALTSAPLTAPAHASMLTGLPVLEHGLVRNGGSTTSPSVVEELRAAGYATGAFVTSRVLQRETGLGSGFMHYDDRWGVQRWSLLFDRDGTRTRPGQRAVDRALDWVEQTDGPRFLWVHLYEPHTPYLPPEGWRPDDDQKAEAAARDAKARPPSKDLKGFKENLRSGFGAGQRLMYAAEVDYTDHLVGQVLDGLPQARVIVVGDHGEGLGEHDEWFDHGQHLFESTVAVPLATRGLGEGHDELVGVHQVAEALRAAAELGGVVFEPQNSVALFTPGQHTQPGPSVAVAAVRTPTGKSVQVTGQPPVYYDLALDPTEDDPRPLPRDPVLDAMLSSFPEVTPEEQRRMRALGYIE